MTYLRNAWYVAALSSEIGEKPLARRLLDQDMALFRTQDGAIGLIADRCPHRFAPLSMGVVRGAEIECAYHGLRFGRDGRCAHNPHGDGRIPRGADLPAWPTQERYGFVWFWPGDPARADAGLIPELPFNDDPARFAPVYGYLDVAGNYQLVVDNLLDLSHVEYLHPMFAQPEGVSAHKTQLIVEDDVVISKRWKPNVAIQGLARLFWTSPSQRFDARAHMTWRAPSAMVFDLGGTECGATDEDGVCLPQAHLITPASEFRCHYFWSLARNRQIDDAQAGERIRTVTQRVFETEDARMIEAQQRNMGAVSDMMSLRPLSLEPDAPAMRARRILAEKIRLEQEAGRVAAQ